jgi:hypothetical protein
MLTSLATIVAGARERVGQEKVGGTFSDAQCLAAIAQPELASLTFCQLCTHRYTTWLCG